MSSRAIAAAVAATTLISALISPTSASASPSFDEEVVGPGLAAMYASGLEYDAFNDRLVIADTGLNRVLTYSTSGTLLGAFGEPGTGPGQFDTPRDAAVDGDGNIYISEGGNDRIQSFTAAGEHRWTRSNGVDCACLNTSIGLTWDAQNQALIVAATGSNKISGWSSAGDLLWVSPTGATAGFDGPRDAGRAPDGTVWVADYGHNRIAFFDVSPGGIWSAFSPTQYHRYELVEPIGAGKIDTPYNAVFSPDGNTAYVTSTGTASIVRYDMSSGGENATPLVPWGGHCPNHPDPCLDPPAPQSAGKFNHLRRTAIDSTGKVYAADFWGGGIEVFNPDGSVGPAIEGKTAVLPGVAEAASVDVAPDGTRYVFDRLNHRVERFDSSGFLNARGARGSEPGYFLWPEALTVGPDGTVWAVDTRGREIHRMAADLSGPVVSFDSKSDAIGTMNYPTGADVDPSGRVWLADSRNNRIVRYDPTSNAWFTFGTAGAAPGQLAVPQGVAVTSDVVFVADTNNNRVQKFAYDGTLLTTSSLALNHPEGLDVADDGTVWVADTLNHRVVHLNSDLNEIDSFGSFGAGDLEFHSPHDLAVDGDIILVADTLNHRVQAVDAGEPSIPPPLTPDYQSEISDPGGIAPLYPAGAAVDTNGDTYIIDAGGNRVMRRASDGTFTPITVAGLSGARDIQWDADGEHLWISNTNGHTLVKITKTGTVVDTIGGSAQLTSQTGIDVDATGIYVSNTYDFNVKKLTTDGTELWTTTACFGSDISRTRDLALGDDGRVYVADTDNRRVVVLNAATGACLDEWGQAGSAPGQFRQPRAIIADGVGGVWVGDDANRALSNFTATGTLISDTRLPYGLGPGRITIFACLYRDGDLLNVCDMFGRQIQSFLLDAQNVPTFDSMIGGVQPAPGGFNGPFGLGFAPNGDLYVTDWWNHRVQRFDANGNFVTEWGAYGSQEGSFIFPRDVVVTPDGSTVVVTNSEGSAVDLFDPDGTFISRIRPQGEGERFYRPHQTALAADGTFWVADTLNQRAVHVDSAGVVLDNWGGPAFEFNNPRGIAVGPDQSVYVADTDNNRVQRFDATGSLTSTIADEGSGPGQVKSPQHLDVVEVDGFDYLLVTDGGNHRIQVFTLDGEYVSEFGQLGTGTAQFDQPKDVAVSADGRVAVADFNNDRVSLWSLDVTSVNVEPNSSVTAPAVDEEVVSPVTFTGDATDDSGVTSVRVSILDRDAQAWLQSDGTFGPELALLVATLTEVNVPSTSWSFISALPEGNYGISVRAVDTAGLVETSRPWVTFSVLGNVVDVEPDTVVTAPVVGAELSSPVTFTGTATDDTAVGRVRLAIRDTVTLDWLQSDGTFAPGFELLEATLSNPGAADTDWSYSAELPQGSYGVSVRAFDGDGRVETTRPWVRFTVA